MAVKTEAELETERDTFTNGGANTALKFRTFLGNIIDTMFDSSTSTDIDGLSEQTTLEETNDHFIVFDNTAGSNIRIDLDNLRQNIFKGLSKSITIESPSSSEDISMFFTNVAITITEIRAVLRGSSTPSVTWTIRHGTDRSAAGSEVVTSGTTTTSTTTGSDVTTFNDATIVADSFVWLETTAQSGTVNELNVTVVYNVDIV